MAAVLVGEVLNRQKLMLHGTSKPLSFTSDAATDTTDTDDAATATVNGATNTTTTTDATIDSATATTATNVDKGAFTFTAGRLVYFFFFFFFFSPFEEFSHCKGDKKSKLRATITR